MKHFLSDEAATLALGAAFAHGLASGLVVYLEGELGAGKTTFTRGVLRGLGYRGRVKSPTFTLVEVYEFSKLNFYHFDFYRFDDPPTLREAGLGEYFRSDAVCLVEWPGKARGLPPPDVRVRFTVEDGGRAVVLCAETEAGQRCLKRMNDSQKT